MATDVFTSADSGQTGTPSTLVPTNASFINENSGRFDGGFLPWNVNSTWNVIPPAQNVEELCQSAGNSTHDLPLGLKSGVDASVASLWRISDFAVFVTDFPFPVYPGSPSEGLSPIAIERLKDPEHAIRFVVDVAAQVVLTFGV